MGKGKGEKLDSFPLSPYALSFLNFPFLIIFLPNSQLKTVLQKVYWLNILISATGVGLNVQN